MKKTAYILAILIALISALMFSCGGGGADNAISDYTYTISYNANGAESGKPPATQKGEGGSYLIISDNIGGMTKSGYLFDGWDTQPDGHGVILMPGASKSGDYTLYARWAPLFYYEIINNAFPAASLNGVQRAPSLSSIRITGLTQYGEKFSSINIPSTIDGYTVSEIGDYAFSNRTGLENIIIPDTVTSIGDFAFAECSLLDNLTIPETVTSIGNSVFSGCSNLSFVMMQSSTPPAIENDSLAGTAATIWVPASGASAYTESDWCNYTSSIVWYDSQDGLVAIGATTNLNVLIITFDSQDATTPSRPTKKSITLPTVTLEQLPTPPVKTGYLFGGWYTRPNGAGEEFTDSTEVTQDITVYAKWNTYEYTVTFDGQGADSNPNPASTTVRSPHTTVSSMPSQIKKAGFYFGGWNTKVDGTGSAFTASTPVTSDITVYAVWMNNPTFIVTFDGQDATTNANPSSKPVISPAVTVGSLPAPPTKTGYSFGGWYTQPNGKGTAFLANTVVNSNQTVYAKWTAETYQIIYKDQGGTAFSGTHGSNYPTSHTYGVKKTTLVAPTKDGYGFGGWYAESDCSGVPIDSLDPQSISSDIILYAKWVSHAYNVVFDSWGANTSATPGTILVESPATTVGSLPTPPTKTGYSFGGWYTQPNGKGTAFLANTVVNGNQTVYAKWNAETYQIIYKDQGGNAFSGIPGSNHPIRHTYGANTTLVNPTREGYSFSGWYLDSGCTGSAITSLGATAYTETITIYAKWIPEYYSVNFESITNGSITANVTANIIFGTSVTLTVLPDYSCYKLTSITVTTADGGKVNVNEISAGNSYSFSMPSDNVTVSGTFDLIYANINELKVGDIVLLSTRNEDRYVTYSNFIVNPSAYTRSNILIGVICYKGRTGSYGTTGKIYMIGEHQENLVWAPQDTVGYLNKYDTSDSSGEYNMELIDPTGSSANYRSFPALEFAANYEAGFVGYTRYNSGWFIPSKNELQQIFNNKETINNSISAARGRSLPSSGYVWSSSQYSVTGNEYTDGTNSVWAFDTERSMTSQRKDKKAYVHVVHVLEE